MPVVPNYYQEQQEMMLAFGSASHRRLGSGSFAHELTPELHELVAGNFLPPRFIPTFHSLSDLSRPELLEGRLPSEAIYTNLSENGASPIELEISSPTLQRVLYEGRMPRVRENTSTENGEIHRNPDIPGYFIYIKEHYREEYAHSDAEKIYDVILLIYLPSDTLPLLNVETIICPASKICEMMSEFRGRVFRFPGKFFDFEGRVRQRYMQRLYFHEPCTKKTGEIFDVRFPAASLFLRVNPNQNFSPGKMFARFSSPGFPM